MQATLQLCIRLINSLPVHASDLYILETYTIGDCTFDDAFKDISNALKDILKAHLIKWCCPALTLISYTHRLRFVAEFSLDPGSPPPREAMPPLRSIEDALRFLIGVFGAMEPKTFTPSLPGLVREFFLLSILFALFVLLLLARESFALEVSMVLVEDVKVTLARTRFKFDVKFSEDVDTLQTSAKVKQM